MAKLKRPRAVDVELIRKMRPGESYRPETLGGRSNSFHSKAFRRLAVLGLTVASERKDSYEGRGAHLYQLTPEGARLWALLDAMPRLHFDSIWTTFLVDRAENPSARD